MVRTSCAQCGLELQNGTEICSHHHQIHDPEWSAGNRIMCDFFHRGKIPVRLRKEDRDTDLCIDSSSPPPGDY